LKKLLHKIKSNLFAFFWLVAQWFEKRVKDLRPRTKEVQKIPITKMTLKEGDQYRLGEAIVTLAKFGIEGKQEVAKKIEAANRRRAERQARLTERGIEMMLMSEEEILELQVNEWIESRKRINEKKIYDNLSPVVPNEIIKELNNAI
jgi:hypothetical protein